MLESYRPARDCCLQGYLDLVVSAKADWHLPFETRHSSHVCGWAIRQSKACVLARRLSHPGYGHCQHELAHARANPATQNSPDHRRQRLCLTMKTEVDFD